jgi:hypothetical protein
MVIINILKIEYLEPKEGFALKELPLNTILNNNLRCVLEQGLLFPAKETKI